MNRRDDHPCIDFDFHGHMYHTWHLSRWCANGELVQVDVRVPGVIVCGRIHCNPIRRDEAAYRIRSARRQLRAAVADAGGLA
ncbi:hypothetical protein EU642_21810 [Salmonella enterica]|nr:hypothetical protein [Salmonella enterica]EAR6391607.1 hypothetical protein [Salmonella enterica]EAV1285252.1 hypothetical protein [Salmonella enterica]